MTRRPLAGLRVIECASFVAGPTGGMTLAQLGASVIRIDPVGGGPDHRRSPVVGDGAAGLDAESYYWSSLNKGKRSVAVDMRSDEGRELVTALVAAPGPDAGILVDNVVGRSWMAHEALSRHRADLVHVRVQGHPDGRPAVDYTVNAESGLPWITGPENGSAPVNHVLPAWDLITGLTVSTAVLAALHDRARTGEGAFVELALADVALAGVANLGWYSEADERRADRPRHGNHIYGSFGVDVACSDGERVMIVALTPFQWSALCSVTGTEEVFAALERSLDADFSLESERYRFRDTIAAVLKPWFAARDSVQVAKELERARVLAGSYRHMPDVVDRYRAGGHPVLADLPLADGTGSITGRSPLRWGGDYGDPGAAPLLGRETEEVLTEILGLSAAEIGGLKERAVIG